MALESNTQVNHTDKTTIKNWFKTALKPTQAQFWATWDSYWHKSESLPISAVNNLGNVLDSKADNNHSHNQYATNDATSLNEQNVTSWQKVLGVDNLEFDDNAISITSDYLDLGVPAGAKIKAFNNAIHNEVNKKLNAPTENDTEEYVLLADGSTAAKAEFGKVDTIDGITADENKDVKLGAVRNSKGNTVTEQFSIQQENGAYVSIDTEGVKVSQGGISSLLKSESITVVNQVPSAVYQFQELMFPKRKAIGVEEKVYPITYINGVKANENGRADIWGVANNWTNPQQRFSALVDKSADATFNRLLGTDSNGNVNEVGLSAITNEMAKSTDAQKDAFRLASRKTGETYSIGQPRVDFINPPMLDKTKDYNQYITIIGINLFLNPVTTILKFRHTVTREEIQITNFQTQQTNAQILVISEDFSTWNPGNWEVLISNNGLDNILSNVTLEVTESLVSEQINLSWDKIKTSDNQPPTTLETTPNSLSIKGSTTQGATIQSSVLVTEADKVNGCIVALTFTGQSFHDAHYNFNSNYFIGFMGSDDEVLLTPSVEIGWRIENTFSATTMSFLPSGSNTGIVAPAVDDTIYYMFKGNICTMYFFKYNKLQIVTTNALKGDLSLKVFRSQGSLGDGYLTLNISSKFVKTLQNRP